MHRQLGTAIMLLVIAGPVAATEPRPTLPAPATTPAATGPTTGGRSVVRLDPGAPGAILPRSGDSPVAMRDAFLARVGGTLAVPGSRGVLVNDSDPENDPIWAANFFPPAHGTLTIYTDGSFNYTTTLVAAGVDSFQYLVHDGTSYSEFVTVRLDVLEGANRVPAAIPDHYGAASDEVLVVPAACGLLANDRDLDGDALLATNYFPADHGQVSLVADGSFTYAPEAGYQGPDQFQYIILDAQGAYSAWATVAIEVLAPRNRAPLAQEDWYYTPSGMPLTVNGVGGLLRNDVDPEGDAISAAQYFPPAEGSLSLVSDGSFNYTPPPAFTGVAQSSYCLVDAQGRYSGFAPLHLLVGVYGEIPAGVLTPPTADGFALHAPSPNPFNPRTSIRFRLGEDGPVQVRVYDVRGREVVKLVDGPLPAGEHDVIWEGRDAAGRRVADGPYVVELRDAQRRAVQKLMLVE